MLSRTADAIARFWVRRSTTVQMGAGSRLRWRSLLATRGGRIQIGAQSMITPRRIDFDGPEGLVRIGDRTFVGASHLVCRREIVIGDDVLVSWGERILAGNPARVIRQLHAHGGSA